MKPRSYPIRILALLLAMALMLSACAIEQPAVVVDPETVDDATTESTTADEIPQTTTATRGVGNASDLLIVASSLLDYDFENSDGEVSGEIEDLIFDIETGDVLYASLEYGGFLDIGDTELPMPLSAFVWGPEGQLILNIDENTLDAFPDLGTEWPDLSNPNWDDEIATFWRDSGLEPIADITEANDSIALVSNITGYGVADVGLGASTVGDMLIDLGESKVKYALLSYDPTLYGDELVAVPFDAMSFSMTENQLIFAEGVDATMLENAPRVSVGNVVTDADTLYNDANTYWGGLGYGPTMTDPATQEELDVDEDAAIDDQTGDLDAIRGVAGSEGSLVRASTLLGYNIYNLNGDNIGEIYDLLIDVESGNILFATLEYGGFLDLGDREIPVPLSAFNWVAENELTLNVAEEQLDALPEVDDEWPNVADATWNDAIVDFWNDNNVDPGYGATDAQTVMYVSNLIDFNLADTGFGAQGALDDLLIDLSGSNAPYTVVDYGGLLNENLVAMPFGAFDVTAANGEFTFTPNIDLDTLQTAPQIERDSFEENGLFTQEIAAEWNSFWRELGYDLGLR